MASALSESARVNRLNRSRWRAVSKAAVQRQEFRLIAEIDRGHSDGGCLHVDVRPRCAFSAACPGGGGVSISASAAMRGAPSSTYHTLPAGRGRLERCAPGFQPLVPFVGVPHRQRAHRDAVDHPVEVGVRLLGVGSAGVENRRFSSAHSTRSSTRPRASSRGSRLRVVLSSVRPVSEQSCRVSGSRCSSAPCPVAVPLPADPVSVAVSTPVFAPARLFFQRLSVLRVVTALCGPGCRAAVAGSVFFPAVWSDGLRVPEAFSRLRGGSGRGRCSTRFIAFVIAGV